MQKNKVRTNNHPILVENVDGYYFKVHSNNRELFNVDKQNQIKQKRYSVKVSKHKDAINNDPSDIF